MTPDGLREVIEGVPCVCGFQYREHPWTALDESCDEWSPHPGSVEQAVRDWIKQQRPAARSVPGTYSDETWGNLGYNAALADFARALGVGE